MGGGIKVLAKRLGVAPSSVSRALSGKPGVSEELRRKILSMAGDLAYAPSPAASALRTGRGQGLALLVPCKPTQITAIRNRKLIEAAQRRFGGVRVHAISDGETFDEAVRRVIAWGPMAIITSSVSGGLARETRARLKDARIPLTTLDGEVDGSDAVVIDRAKGVSQATRLMLLSGRTHPIFLTGATLDAPDERLEGVRRGFESMGLSLSEIKGGVVTAVLFTFIPIFGAYAVPLLIGGKDSYMLGNVIADQVTKTRNWPLASAISMTVTLLTAISVFLFAIKKPKEQHAIKDIDPLGSAEGKPGQPKIAGSGSAGVQ